MGDNAGILAVSDLLVLTALERAWARTRQRRAGAKANNAPAAARHNQYLQQPVPEQRIEQALRDAWALCPLLAHRHGFDVDPLAWMQLLDSYARALLMAGQPHLVTELGRHLQSLPEPPAAGEVDWHETG